MQTVIRRTRWSAALGAWVACWAVILVAEAAQACSCLPRSFPEHYCDADFVGELHFTAQKADSNTTVYDANVVRVFKGEVATRSIEVVTPTSSAACGVTFEVGANAPTYLITGRFAGDDPNSAPSIVHTNLCDYQDAEPSAEVRRFLENPSCPCGDIECRPHQECRIYEAPEDPTSREPYCADTCNGFECPPDHVCKLREVQCVREPCPPQAVCVSRDPCDTVLCREGFVCEVDADGNPSCVPDGDPGACRTDADCETGYCRAGQCAPFQEVGEKCNVGFSQFGALTCGPDLVCACSQCCAGDKSKCDKSKKDKHGEPGCVAVCHALPQPGFCRSKPEPGPCEAAIPRFYFDPNLGDCQRFVYGGCGGNENNFATLEECRGTCGPTDPAPGACGATTCDAGMECRVDKRGEPFCARGQ